MDVNFQSMKEKTNKIDFMAKDYQLLGKIKKTLNKYIFVVLREPPRQSEAVVYGHSEGL